MSKPASLRDAMPSTAAFIDEMRAVFGAEDINASIRAGLDGQPTFWASEGGAEIGTKDHRVGIALSDMVIDAPGATVKAGKGKLC